jgi:glutaminyl-tRNA synthetase
MASAVMADKSGRKEDPGTAHNFIRAIVAADVAAGKHGGQVVTRFPPEPNGYPHIGHVKAMSISHGVAREFGGRFHLRFDDTNPANESMEYVEAIQRDVRWLGFDWGQHLYFASDYFERLYGFACELIRAGKAYVCSLNEEAMRLGRGTLTQAGTPSPYRAREVAENLDLFARMRAGEFADGAHVLRAKIDMASPNMKMRDPAIYRIRHKHHYRMGNSWCIYPLYDFQHCLSDAIEGVTHSLCSLEFENNRELYDWFVANVSVGHVPRQYEFARLNLTYTVTSKRTLRELVESGQVSGWDDPRMPTVSGMRRRGYTPEALRDFCERVGVARNQSTAEFELLEHCVREDLNHRAPRVLCVLRPLKLVIENYPLGQTEQFDAPYYPPDVPGGGTRTLQFARELWIEADDFADPPPKKWHRLAPGTEVRLRYGYIIRCTSVVRDAAGKVTELRAEYDPESRTGATAGRAIKGTLHWVAAHAAIPCEVRLYERLFNNPDPLGEEGTPASAALNPHSLTVVQAFAEPSIADSTAGQRFQFERQGFFCLDPASSPNRLVFNRTVALKDSWARLNQGAKETPAAKPAEAENTGAAPHEAAAESSRGPSSARSGALGPAASRPELSAAAQTLRAAHGLTDEQARLLSGRPGLADFFADALTVHSNARGVANFVTTEVLHALKQCEVTALPFRGTQVGELVQLVEAGTISLAAAKVVFASMLAGRGTASEIVAADGLGRVVDHAQLDAWVNGVLGRHPALVAKYRDGQHGVLGALVGHVMRESQGRADPAEVNRLLRVQLDSAI